jgi:SWI/SNF-related matrix-associated actin-dependent regulator of chromatin subfamily A3
MTQLLDFQEKTVLQMKTFEELYDGGMLFNSPGLGKTLCCLKIIDSVTLIICPSGLVDNWINEIKQHTDIKDSQISKYTGPKRSVELNKRIYITSFNIIGGEWCKDNKGDNDKDKFIKNSLFNESFFERVILDEAHFIRNSKNIATRAIFDFSSRLCINVKRWVVTATPIFNSSKDTFSYFRFLSLEGIEDKSTFNREYSRSIVGMKRLNNLIKKYSIQYKKEIVLPNLSKKTEHLIYLEFTPEERTFYDALIDYSRQRLSSIIQKMNDLNPDFTELKKVMHNNVMLYILRLKQACDSPMLVLKSMKRLNNVNSFAEASERLKPFIDTDTDCPICYDQEADYAADPCGHRCCKTCWDRMFNVHLNKCPKCRSAVNLIKPSLELNVNQMTQMNQLNQSAKIEKLIEITKEIVNRGEKIVIVSQWVSMLNLIRNAFEKEDTLKEIRSINLQGNVPMKMRTEYIQQFQTDSQVKICFLSLMSSAEGINLIAANHIVVVDQWWNNAKIIQACDRIHRIGQKREVNVYKLYINSTIEEKILKRLQTKSIINELLLEKWQESNEVDLPANISLFE